MLYLVPIHIAPLISSNTSSRKAFDNLVFNIVLLRFVNWRDSQQASTELLIYLILYRHLNKLTELISDKEPEQWRNVRCCLYGGILKLKSKIQGNMFIIFTGGQSVFQFAFLHSHNGG
jgi:hypothetical protein